MSELDNAIAEISDPKIQARVRRAVSEVTNGRRYGLVFEKHFAAEEVALLGLPIKVGSKVTLRTEPANGVRYFEVIDLEGETATIVPAGDDEQREVPTADLLVVQPFEEPIYPGLTSVGRIDRGGPDKPTHMVWNAENFHALQMLLFTHAGKVDVIYIDPPYNTGNPDWKYNNRFIDDNDTWRHSKWLSMMETRLKLAEKLLKPDGVLIVTIDEHEVHRLGVLLDQMFPQARQQMVTIVTSSKGSTRSQLFSRVEEYAIFNFFGEAEVSPQADNFLTETNGDEPEVDWESLLRRGSEAARADRPHMCFPIYVDTEKKRIVGAGDPIPDGDEPDVGGFTPDGHQMAWPIRRDGSVGRWRIGRKTFGELLDRGFVRLGQWDKRRQTWAVRYLQEGNRKLIEEGKAEIRGYLDDGSADVHYVDLDIRRPRTVWFRSAHSAGDHGSSLLTSFLGKRLFDYPKSLYAVADTLATVAGKNREAVILDFFAGSGTTLHATAMLNAQDEGSRQCILVTNNDLGQKEAKTLNKKGYFRGDPEFESSGIFESVTKPRVEAALTGARPDGKPVKGKYLPTYLEGHPYADGFEENVEFFGVEYLDPDVVSLGRQYDAIAPMLWAASGSVGEWETRDGDAAWSAPKTSTYAILFEEDAFVEFRDHLRDRPEITHIWLVTNSRPSFADMRAELPRDLTVGMLYRDYLRNFEINTAEALR